MFELQWHFDDAFVNVNSETHYLWWAVDNEDKVLERYITMR